MRKIHMRARIKSAARGIFIGILLAALPPGGAGAAEPVTVIVEQVPLNPKQPDAERIGLLSYRGGLVLRSADPRFGGYSGMMISADGEWMTAISDRGTWLRARLRYDEAGRLTGVLGAEIGPLIGRDGKPLRGSAADAEAVTEMPDGSLLVAFERRHRLLLYPPADPPFSKPPVLYPAPNDLKAAPSNGGMEALTHVGSGYLLAISEKLGAGGPRVAGWVGVDGTWRRLTYPRTDGFRTTDITLLPDGNVLALERRFVMGDGNAVRFRLIERRAIAPGRLVDGTLIGQLEKPLTVDNMEALAARPGPGREMIVYVLSDDNFNRPQQRTILMMFTLPR